MQAPRTILVPIDLSARSLLGLDYAAMLATATDASLLLFCNVNVPERAVLEEYAAAEHLTVEEAGLAQLRHHASSHAPGVDVEVLIGADDSPAHGILQVAARDDVDCIVIARHGRTGMTRWLLGSIAEKISRTAEVPVVIVPARTTEPVS